MPTPDSASLIAFWQPHLAQWQLSGLSQAAYCLQHDLSKSQFGYWKKQLLPAVLPVADAAQSGFTRVQVARADLPQASSALSLHFADGVQITGINQANLAVAQQLVGLLR